MATNSSQNTNIGFERSFIISHLETCQEPETRMIILKVLSALLQGKEERIELLIQGLNDPDENVREVFARTANYRSRKITKHVQNRLWELMNNSLESTSS